MEIDKILSELRGERDRIDQTITAIESLNSADQRTGRRAGSTKTATTRSKRRRRPMSAAARKKLSQLLKQRWAQGKMKGRRKAA
jgi:hypothetical protein